MINCKTVVYSGCDPHGTCREQTGVAICILLGAPWCWNHSSFGSGGMWPVCAIAFSSDSSEYARSVAPIEEKMRLSAGH